MSYYRLYFHNETGQFMRVQELHVDSDAEALDFARTLDQACDVEVWQQGRSVGIVRPDGKKR